MSLAWVFSGEKGRVFNGQFHCVLHLKREVYCNMQYHALRPNKKSAADADGTAAVSQTSRSTHSLSIALRASNGLRLGLATAARPDHAAMSSCALK